MPENPWTKYFKLKPATLPTKQQLYDMKEKDMQGTSMSTPYAATMGLINYAKGFFGRSPNEQIPISTPTELVIPDQQQVSQTTPVQKTLNIPLVQGSPKGGGFDLQGTPPIVTQTTSTQPGQQQQTQQPTIENPVIETPVAKTVVNPNETFPLDLNPYTMGEQNKFVPMKPTGLQTKTLSPEVSIKDPEHLTPQDQAFLDKSKNVQGLSENPEQWNTMDLAVDQYGRQLEDINKRANLVDGAKALGNISAIISTLTLDKPDQILAPKVKAPRFISPGEYLRNAQMGEIDKNTNTANKILAETGRADAIVGNTANANEAANKVNSESIVSDVNIQNQQIQADVNADNQNMASAMDAYNKNIESKLRYNMIRGNNLTEAFNALGDQGTQYINRLGQSNYGMFQARMSAEEARLMEQQMLHASLLDSRDKNTNVDTNPKTK